MKDDKYRDGEEGKTQLRSIIDRLNEEHPSKEKFREVVVRPDGTKVIRVTKKRRVSVTEADKKRRSRRQLMFGLLVAFLILVGMGAFFGFRMSMMSGEGFVEDGVAHLKEAWGATDVRVTGKGVDGSSFHITTLEADFPADSLIEHVEMTDVDAKLDAMSFFTKKLMGSQLTIARAEVRLKPGVREFRMPRYQGGTVLWDFARVQCNDLTVKVGDSVQESPVSLRNTRAYLYYPRLSDKNSCIIVLNDGVLQMGEWKPVYVKEGKINLSPNAIENFLVEGTTNRATDTEEANRVRLSVSGRLAEGDSLAGPFTFDSDNMELADFSHGRFALFLTARTVSATAAKSRATITLPLEKPMPQFDGEMPLKTISLSGMPAQTMVTEHIEPSKRRLYLPFRVSRGAAVLSHEGETISVAFTEGAMEERDLLSLQGKMSINADNELSGTMAYGIPAVLTHVEYTDGLADPVFQETGDKAWLRTELSGTANRPSDNTSQIELAAEEARKSRPQRIPFDQIDVNRMAEQMQKGEPATMDIGSQLDPLAPTAPAVRNPFDETPSAGTSDPFGDGESKKQTEDPFALPTPF